MAIAAEEPATMPSDTPAKTAAGKKKSPAKGAKTSPVKAVPDAATIKRKDQIEAMAEDLAVLKTVKPYLLQYSLQMAQTAVFLEFTLFPALMTAFQYCMDMWVKLEPHLHTSLFQEILPMLAGFCLCFFGGTFPLLIASVEAFRMAGYQGMKVAIQSLYTEGKVALEANKKDDAVDDDGDGIPDVEQITPRELLTRKTFLVLKVVNPEKVSTAVASLSAGLLAVLASLKMSFARALTLGATLGVVLQKQVDLQVVPVLQETCPPEAKQWIPIVLSWVCKIVSCWIAFMLQTIISAFHSAIRGGQMFGVALVRYLHKRGKLEFNEEESLLDEMVGYGCAGAGFLFQLYMQFSLPFPFYIVFMPLSMAEYMLAVLVSWF